MLSTISIIFNNPKDKNTEQNSIRLPELVAGEVIYEVHLQSSSFWISGTKKEIEKNVYEDSNVLVILYGYILHSQINYENNLAKELLDLFNKKQVNLYIELSGVFVLIIFNKKTNRLIISNDRLGVKPFYYYRSDNKFIFSSDIKSIALSGFIEKEVNWRAWGDIFNYGFIIGDETPFKKVFSLPMASVLTNNDDNFELKKYWSFNQIKINYKQSENEIIQKGIELLKKIAGRYNRFIRYAEFGLSGGYDSRCIACCLKYFSNIKFKTITSDLHAKGKRDVIIARELAKVLNINNSQVSDDNLYQKYFIDMIYLAEGMTFEHLWTMALRNSLKKSVDSFDGLIVDIFLSSKRSIRARASDKKDYSDEEIINFFLSDKRIAANKCIEFFNAEVKKLLAEDRNKFYEQIRDIQENKYKLKYLFINNRVKNSLAIASKKIIGSYINNHSFFIDNDFIDFCLSINPRVEVKQNIYFKILKRAFAEIMKIPTTNEYPPLFDIKKKVIYRIKDLTKNERLIKLFSLIGIDIKKYKKFNLKEKIPALPLSKEDENYLIDLINKLVFPKELNKELLLNEIAKNNTQKIETSNILIPIANFLVWYNLFIINRSVKELKSLLRI